MHGQTAYYQYHPQFKDEVSHAKNQSTPYFQLPDNVGSKNLELTLEISLDKLKRLVTSSFFSQNALSCEYYKLNP